MAKQKPQIYFDATCPVCSNYIRLVKKKVSESQVEYLPSGSEAKDFKYVDANGSTYTGSVAIDKLALDFPAITEYMFMLPPSLKPLGLKAAYKIGSAIRRTVAKVKKGCNCGH